MRIIIHTMTSPAILVTAYVCTCSYDEKVVLLLIMFCLRAVLTTENKFYFSVVVLRREKKEGELVLTVIDNNIKESKSETAEYLLVRLKLESERLLRK